LNFSSRSVSSTALLPFRKSASQYRANNSGDFVVLPAATVTALLLINFPQALSRAAVKPCSLLKASYTSLKNLV